MNDEEIRVFFRDLIVYLRESGLGWVLRQVVADGDAMDDAEIDSALLDSHSLRRNISDVLDALEILLVEAVEMEVQISDFFAQQDGTETSHLNTLDIPESNRLEIDRLAAPERVEASYRIRSIIDDLRGLVE